MWQWFACESIAIKLHKMYLNNMDIYIHVFILVNIERWRMTLLDIKTSTLNKNKKTQTSICTAHLHEINRKELMVEPEFLHPLIYRSASDHSVSCSLSLIVMALTSVYSASAYSPLHTHVILILLISRTFACIITGK